MLIVSPDCVKGKHEEEALKLFEEILLPCPIMFLYHEPPYFSLLSLFYTNEYKTTANIYFLLSFAFETLKVKTSIVLESDLVPSSDFFEQVN